MAGVNFEALKIPTRNLIGTLVVNRWRPKAIDPVVFIEAITNPLVSLMRKLPVSGFDRHGHIHKWREASYKGPVTFQLRSSKGLLKVVSPPPPPPVQINAQALQKVRSVTRPLRRTAPTYSHRGLIHCESEFDRNQETPLHTVKSDFVFHHRRRRGKCSDIEECSTATMVGFQVCSRKTQEAEQFVQLNFLGSKDNGARQCPLFSPHVRRKQLQVAQECKQKVQLPLHSRT